MMNSHAGAENTARFFKRDHLVGSKTVFAKHLDIKNQFVLLGCQNSERPSSIHPADSRSTTKRYGVCQHSYLIQPNVEVSCGPDACRNCTAFYDEPPHYTPSAPLGCYVSAPLLVYREIISCIRIR